MRRHAVDCLLRSAEQLDVETATGEQHVFQRFTDIGDVDGPAAAATDACLSEACGRPSQLQRDG